MECNICFESFDASEMVSLKCSEKHNFCRRCMIQWYNTTVYSNCVIPNDKIYACPICRQYGGIGVIRDLCEISYHFTVEKMNQYSTSICFCKTNDAHYGNSTYCMQPIDDVYDCALIHFPDTEDEKGGNPEIKKIGLCQKHLIDYARGKTLYHFCKQTVVKDKSHIITNCSGPTEEMVTLNVDESFA